MAPNEWITEAENEEEKRIRMRRRKIKAHLLDFKEFLNTKNYTLLTIRQTIIAVRSFYREFDIELPKMFLQSDKRQESREDIPTKKHIEIALRHVKPRDKAIILTMSSSGMGASEILSLKIKDLLISLKDEINIPKSNVFNVDELIELVEKKRKENPLLIPTWHITRIKTEMPYITFSSPESLTAILNYLEIKPTENIEDPLFRNPHNNQMDIETFYKYFLRLNKTCGFGTPDRQAFFRSHNLRKYFATTISEHIPKLKVDRMLGHRVDSITNSYFKTNLPELKQAYIKAIPFISIEDTEVKVLESEDKKLLNELQVKNLEKDKLIKEQETRLKRIERFMEEKERTDNLKKP
jgi:integrase